MPTIEAPADAVGDARDVIATAIALGMEVPAPIGCVAYHASVTMLGTLRGDLDSDIELGVYASIAGALSAACEWIIGEWDHMYDMHGETPWLNDDGQDRLNRELIEGVDQDPSSDEYLACIAVIRREWLATKSDEDIIDAYFGDNTGSDRIHISKITISGPPPRTLAASPA